VCGAAAGAACPVRVGCDHGPAEVSDGAFPGLSPRAQRLGAVRAAQQPARECLPGRGRVEDLDHHPSGQARRRQSRPGRGRLVLQPGPHAPLVQAALARSRRPAARRRRWARAPGHLQVNRSRPGHRQGAAPDEHTTSVSPSAHSTPETRPRRRHLQRRPTAWRRSLDGPAHPNDRRSTGIPGIRAVRRPADKRAASRRSPARRDPGRPLNPRTFYRRTHSTPFLRFRASASDPSERFPDTTGPSERGCAGRVPASTSSKDGRRSGPRPRPTPDAPRHEKTTTNLRTSDVTSHD